MFLREKEVCKRKYNYMPERSLRYLYMNDTDSTVEREENPTKMKAHQKTSAIEVFNPALVNESLFIVSSCCLPISNSLILCKSKVQMT